MTNSLDLRYSYFLFYSSGKWKIINRFSLENLCNSNPFNIWSYIILDMLSIGNQNSIGKLIISTPRPWLMVMDCWVTVRIWKLGWANLTLYFLFWWLLGGAYKWGLNHVKNPISKNHVFNIEPLIQALTF